MTVLLNQSVYGSGTACSYKSAIQSKNFNTKKTGFAIMKPILKRLLEIELPKWDEVLIDSLADELIHENTFETLAQRECNLNEFKVCALRMRDFLVQNNYKVIEVDYRMTIDLNDVLGLKLKDNEMELKIDALLEDEAGEIHFTKFSRQSYYLLKGKYVEGRESKFFHYSLEMYLLSLGATIYSKATGKKMNMTQIFLKQKGENFNDLNNCHVYDFKPLANQNMATTRPETFTLNKALEERLVNLLTKKPTKCQGEECQTCHVAEICNYKHITPIKPKKLASVQQKSSGKVRWTSEQQAFINFEEGVCRTNAVAGAGKTSVIANRFIELLKKGYLAETFLLITFTEKGCQELKEKIEYWLEVEGMDKTLVEKIKVKTFNGFGNDLIKEYYSLLGFKEEPKLIDTVDMMNIVVELSKNRKPIPGLRYNNPTLYMFNAKGAYFEIIELFEQIKKSGLDGYFSAEDIAFELKIPVEAVETYYEFKKICKEQGLIDYTDQIFLAGDLVRQQEVVNKLKLQHIIIDEVQDTNMSQMQIISPLTKTPYFRSLVICGDDSQSIYSFQGATQEIILKFDEMFENVTDLTLSNNFRCTREISKLANRLNAYNIHRMEKDIVAHKNGIEPQLYSSNVTEQNVLSFVQGEIRNGVPLNEIAIIGRVRHQLRAVQEYLTSHGIETTLDCSEYLYENVPVLRIISLASWLLDNKQEMELAKYIQFAEYEEFEKATDSLEWLKQRTEVVAKEWLSKTISEKQKELMSILERYAVDYPGIEVLKKAISSRRYMKFEELLNYMVGIAKFRSDLSVPSTSGSDAVVLTTAHSSKGREFHSVMVLTEKFKSFFAPSREEHFKHNAYDKFDLAGAEEERRLAFVAITRAKEVLAFSGGNSRRKTSIADEIDYLLTGNKTVTITNLEDMISAKQKGKYTLFA